MSDAFTPPPAPMGGEPSSDDRTMAMLAHLLAIVTSFVGPLVIWLINKDKEDKGFVVDQAKEALNFTLTVFGLMIICMIVSTLIGWIPVIGWLIAIALGLLMMAVGLGALVFLIMGGIAANKGETYRYPFAVRLIN